jgi:hypothetical protein
MAVTITKRGTPPSDRVYECRCVQCKTEFTFNASDAERVPDIRDGDFFRIACPVCGHRCTKNTKQPTPPFGG